jgi:hypothetical protein
MIRENVINSSTFRGFADYPVYTSCNVVGDKAVHQIQVAKETRKKVTDAKIKFVWCKSDVCISIIDMYWCVLLAKRLVLKEKENKEVDKYSLSRRKHIELHDTKRYHHF